MKNIGLSVIAIVALAACASAPKTQAPLTSQAQYGTLTSDHADVVLVPQWHLSAQTNTQVSNANLPQSENQRAIYRQLAEWAETGAVKTVIAEGCEGEIDDGFHERFNGWTLADLQKLSAEALDSTMTHVGLKLKAKLGRKIKVICGDSNDLVRKHQLILSDLRGLLGFKIRIEEFANDIGKRADYVSTVVELLKMPSDSDEIDVVNRLNAELKSKLSDFEQVLHERNGRFVAVAKSNSHPEAIVIGALHIDDLRGQLESERLSTATFTPKGLTGDESQLLESVRALLARPTPTRPAKLKPKAERQPPPEAEPEQK